MHMATAFPDVETREETDEASALDRTWNVIVWNDHVNLMNYVVYVFQKVLGFDKPTATKHMLEVHNEGKSLVVSTSKERAELYLQQLQSFGLKTTLQQDS